MKKRGKGIACTIYQTHPPMPNVTSVFIEVAHDGAVRLQVGSCDIGQGSNTVLSQIVAEELGIPIEFVTIQTADTDHAPFCVGSYGTRITYVAGNAVRLAAQNTKEKLMAAASEILQTEPDKLQAKGGKVFVKDNPEKAVPVSDVCGYSYFMRGVAIAGSASFSPSVIPMDPETGQGAASVAYIFGTQVAEVEVDTETGEIRVIKVTAAHDVGKAINPALAEGQIEGGVQMGIGYALMEEVLVDEKGRVMNPNLTDYHVPTAADVPPMEIILVETKEPTGPFGAKGLGEATTCPTAPAIINAIHDAVGVWIRDLPATPEKVLTAMNR